MPTLEEQRRSFIQQSGGFFAFPLAGAIVWLAVGVVSLIVSKAVGVYVLLFATGAIFPLALAIAGITKQRVFQRGNLFGSLMGLAVLMVNLLWAFHFVLLTRLSDLVPLSVALALGIHWIVFGWIIQSPIGVIHAIGRSLLCTAAFLLFPSRGLCAVSFTVVFCYAVTIVQLRRHFSADEKATLKRADASALRSPVIES